MKKTIAIFLTCAMILLNPTTVSANFNLTDNGHLWLVNKENPLPEDFITPDLVEFRGTKLSIFARDAFIEMIAAMEAEGISGLHLQSAYRSREYQQAIFNQRVKELTAKGQSKEEATEKASHSIQFPGASEHQLGLALDVSINGKLTQEFAATPAGSWLEANCHKFGFIIRYPRTKTEITNIVYEPWHLRYVGTPHATIMKEENLTLEEYHRYLANIFMYLAWDTEYDNSYYLIRYYDRLPEELDYVTKFSSIYPQDGYGYIVTLHKSP